MSLTLVTGGASRPLTAGSPGATTGAAADRPSYRPFAVEVVEAFDLSPSFRRLVIAGPDLHECGSTLLDQRVKMVLGEPIPEMLTPDWYLVWRELPATQRPVVRTFTLSEADPGSGRVSIDIACRPMHGPASQFATEAAPGAPFLLIGPDSRSTAGDTDGIAWRPGRAQQVLLVGDETAQPAIRNILRALPEGVTGQVILELPTVEDAVELTAPAGVVVDVVVRGADPVGLASRHLLAPWFAGPLGQPREPGLPQAEEGHPLIWEEAHVHPAPGRYAWCAGEARWIADLRRRERSRTATTRASSFMGYWRSGIAAD